MSRRPVETATQADVTSHDREMVMRRDIQWPSIFAEGIAIVLSILLAFTIDAWWEDRKEVDTQRTQLRSLLGEFKEARHRLVLQLGGLENSLLGTLEILELTGPDATDDVSANFRAALRESLNVGVSTPQQGTLRDVLASGAGIVSSDSDLWSKLQTWPTVMDELEVDGQHLERNREENFIDALVRLGVSMLSIFRPQTGESLADSRLLLQLPRSDFDADLSVLLRDPGIETVFTMRAIRSQLLIAQHKSAIEVADEIIGHLENEN